MPKVGFDSSNPKNPRRFNERLRGETLLFLQGDLNSRTLLEGRGKDLLSEALIWRRNLGPNHALVGRRDKTMAKKVWQIINHPQIHRK